MKGTYVEVRSWLEYRAVGRTPNSPTSAATEFQNSLAPLEAFLDRFKPASADPAILIVDTSALIDCPDLAKLAQASESRPLVLVVPTTVLSELDQLKSSKRTPEFIATVRSAIRELGRLRALGDVLQGVEVADKVMARMLAREPDFTGLPGWLDPSVHDDRILGSAIEVQTSNLDSSVAILTSDINMQNKASLARFPTTDPPECH